MTSRYAAALASAARRQPSRPALWHAGSLWTFAQLQARVEELARWLGSLDLPDGARVADLHPNGVETVISDFACSAAGVVRVALNDRYTTPELRGIIEHVGAAVLLTTPALYQIVGEDWLSARGTYVLDTSRWLAGNPYQPGCEAACTEPTRADRGSPLSIGVPVLALRLTGGTTGRPRAIVRTEAQQLAVAENIRTVLCPLRESDVLIHTQPMSHGTHAFILPAVQSGCLQVVADSTRPGQVADQMQALGVTVLKCVPTLLSRLVSELATHPRSFPALRQIVCGASPLDAPLIQASIEQFGPILSQTYGQTEVPVTIAYTSPDDYKDAARGEGAAGIATAGRPYPGVEIAILDSRGGDVTARGEVGEVGVKSSITAEWEWDGHQAVALRRRSGGYHLTGDLGAFDAAGRLHLMGRKDGVIISGGYNVYPGEVREALLRLPGITGAEVFAVPHADWGQQVTAAVVAASGVEGASVITALRDFLTAYKIPKEILVLPSIPVTVNGKPNIRELARLVASRHSG